MKEVSKYKDKEIIVNCWRGGMRSKTVVSLLDSLGYNTLQLEGGYKAYRAYVKERLYNYQFKPKLVVLYGLTCTGKTELLLKFANSIDLEGLAQHRSSLYGAIGLVPNSQKKFESLLLQKLDELNQEKWVIIEGESRRIGNVIIPELLWKSMKKGVNGHIKRSIENRAKAGVAEYLNTEEKQKGVLEVTKRLFKVISKQKKEEIITNLEEKKYFEAVKILLEFYYDPLYSHTLKSVKFDFEVDNDNVLEGIERINENDYRFE